MILFYNNIPVKKTLIHIVGVLKQDKMDNRHTWVPVGDHEDSILSLLEKNVIVSPFTNLWALLSSYKPKKNEGSINVFALHELLLFFFCNLAPEQFTPPRQTLQYH